MKKLIILLFLLLLLAFTACGIEYRLCYDGVDRWKVQHKTWVFPWVNTESWVTYGDKNDALRSLAIWRGIESRKHREWKCDSQTRSVEVEGLVKEKEGG